MKNEFTLKEVLEATEIPRERFNEWLLRKYIKPSIKKKMGKRTIRTYTRNDVYGIGLFLDLIKIYKFPRNYAASFVGLFLDLSHEVQENLDYLVIKYGRNQSDENEVSVEMLPTTRAGEGVDEKKLKLALNLDDASFGIIDIDSKYNEIGDSTDLKIPKEGNITGPWRHIGLINLHEIKKSVDLALSRI